MLKNTDLDFSAGLSFLVDPCFFVLGLVRKFEGSSFIFAVFAVRPFFFTGSWLEEMSRQASLVYMKVLYNENLSRCFVSSLKDSFTVPMFRS